MSSSGQTTATRRRPERRVVTARDRFERRRARRRALRTLARATVLMVVGALLASVVWAVGWSPLLDLRSVRVSVRTLDVAQSKQPAATRDRLAQEAKDLRAAVQQAARAPLGRPLVRVDTGAIDRRIEAVASVDSATVSRSFPHTVVITVTPRRARAVVKSAAGYGLVDAEGVVFRTVGTAPADLPVVDVAADDSAAAARSAAISVLVALPTPLAAQVESVGAASKDAVELRLVNGATVRWGSAGQPARKAQVLVALLAQQAKAYDVSAPDAPSVRLQ